MSNEWLNHEGLEGSLLVFDVSRQAFGCPPWPAHCNCISSVRKACRALTKTPPFSCICDSKFIKSMWLRLLCGQCWDELLESHFWRWPTAFKKSIWGIVIWNVAASLRSCLVKFNERDGQRWQWNDNAWYPKASLCLWPLLDTVSRFGPLSGVDWPWNGFRIAVESFKVKTPVQSKDEHFWCNHIVYQSCSLYRRLYIGPSFIGSLLCNVWNGLVSLLLAVLRWILTLGQSTGEALPCDTCIFLADTEFLGDIRRLTIQTCLCAAEISWCFSSECCIYIYIYNVCFARV